MPKALTVDLRISERELVLVRKYDNTQVSPRNEGFTCQRVFYWFSSKNIFVTSDKYYHSKYRKNQFTGKKTTFGTLFQWQFHRGAMLFREQSIASLLKKHCFIRRKAMLRQKNFLVTPLVLHHNILIYNNL